MSGNVVHCGAEHGRVGSGRSVALENAARNILVVGGDTEIKNGHVGQHKITGEVAAADEI